MSTVRADLHGWFEAMRLVLYEVNRQDFGYPVDEQVIRPPSGSVRGIPPALHPLYAVCDGVSLPDVHNGYLSWS